MHILKYSLCPDVQKISLADEEKKKNCKIFTFSEPCILIYVCKENQKLLTFLINILIQLYLFDMFRSTINRKTVRAALRYSVMRLYKQYSH